MSAIEPPLFAGSVLGFRMWDVRAGFPSAATRLVAAFSESPWEPGGAWTEAVCTRQRHHAAPRHGCSCGLYAWHPALAAAMRVFRDHQERVVEEDGFLTAMGIVEASGRVEVHAHGFRAQRARPLALVIPGGTPSEHSDGVRELARLYRCEVLEAEGWSAMLDFCTERGGVLSRPQIKALLKPVRKRPPAEAPAQTSPPAAPATPSGPALPGTPRPAPRNRLRRAGSQLVELGLALVVWAVAIAWYGSIAALVVATAGGIVFGWFEEPPGPEPAKVLEAGVDRSRCRAGVVLHAGQPLERVTVRFAARLAGGKGMGHDQRVLREVPGGTSAHWPVRLPRKACTRGMDFTLRARVVRPGGRTGRPAEVHVYGSPVRNPGPPATPGA